MDLIENLIADCAGKLQSAIIMPRILQVNMCDRSLITDNETMALSEACSSSDMHRLFSDIGTIIGFLQTHLPSSIIESLSKVCGPNLVESLISERLSSAVPQDLAALQDFDSTREQIYRFSETLHSCGWPGADQLRAWTNSVPQVWLEKRQRLSLDEVRQLLKRGLGGVRTVERVETQTVPQEDRLFRGNTSSEDWNAEWSDEEGRSPIGDEVIQHGDAGGDEDDVSAWGLDDERDRESKSQEAAPSASDDDEADAWGWGDDHDDESGSKSSQQKLAKSANQGVNGHVTLHPRSEREVTLRETYNITSLPTGILDLMRGIISDVDTLGKLT